MFILIVMTNDTNDPPITSDTNDPVSNFCMSPYLDF